MDLRIQGGGYATGAHDPQWQKRRQDYEALSRALSEGDLPGANEAYANILGQLPYGGRVNAESFLGKMGVALSSADLALARQLMAQGVYRGAQAPGAAGSEADSLAARFSSDGGSPTIALNQAIQSGDPARARLALTAMVAEIQQLTQDSGFSGMGLAGARAYAAAAPAGLAANNLLQNPNFQALEVAILRGDPTGMRLAWAMLMSGTAVADAGPKKPTVLTDAEEKETESSGLWEMQSATVS